MATEYKKIEKSVAQEWHMNYKNAQNDLITRLYGSEVENLTSLYHEYKGLGHKFSSVSFANEDIDKKYKGRNWENSFKFVSVLNRTNFPVNNKQRFKLYLGIKTDTITGISERVDILCYADWFGKENGDNNAEFYEIIGFEPLYNTKTLNGLNDVGFYQWMCEPNCDETLS